MPTNATRTQQASANAVVQAALTKESSARRGEASSAPASAADAPRKAVGYGLPCSKCHLYYPADLDVCPTCKHNQRVSPVVPKIPPKVAQAAVEPIPDTAVVEQEREEFLRQFKSQLMEAHAGVVNAPESVCKFGEHHSGEPAHGEICQACYERLQERLDVFEAALHLELKEAAQIIYDAVWADPSDPSKTYQNAASAILTELRKRAGMTTVLGPFQPLSH
jgi:hypothetical protein